MGASPSHRITYVDGTRVIVIADVAVGVLAGPFCGANRLHTDVTRVTVRVTFTCRADNL